jgi:predicted small lipoprotein YifL
MMDPTTTRWSRALLVLMVLFALAGMKTCGWKGSGYASMEPPQTVSTRW